MAYAAVVSLKLTIKLLLNDSQCRILLPNSELELIYLQSFVKTINSRPSSQRLDALESQIKDFAHKFEDLIESHVSDPFLNPESGNESLSLMFYQELFKVKQEINSFIGEVQSSNTEEQPRTRSSSSAADAGKNKVVGLVSEVLQLLGWLVLHSSQLDVVSIVGMAGIGKTTLAREVYDDSFISDYFHVRLFVSVGQKYELREVLLLLLVQLGFPLHEMHQKKDKELGESLHTYLGDAKYLIVLDDVWDAKVWDELQYFFPVNDSRSRIIVTTRLVDVAPRIRKDRNILQMPFLNDDESWKLLHDIVFGNEEWCDPQLEKIGREIARKCEGLPLAIIAVGNELVKIEKTVEMWTKAEEDENLLIICSTDDDSAISKSLTLSYKELPQHLKPFFLYMAVFPHKYEITACKLNRLWGAEGFLEPQFCKSLEETAEKILDNLVSRSLVLVCKRSSGGRIKTCKLHFVFRILCISEAENEKFFHVMKKAKDSFTEGTCNRHRRLCIHNNVVLSIKQVLCAMESVSAMRSLLCFGQMNQYPLPVCLQFRLLRVLDAFAIRFYKFPDEVLELVQLRYLAITYDGDHPEYICTLWKLEVLIVRQYRSIKHSHTPVYLPIRIWKLKRLKHLECVGFDLPDPSGDAENSLLLEKILTLSGVSFHSCKPVVLARMPNLMRLGVRIKSRNSEAKSFILYGDLTNLHCLESFKCVVDPVVGSRAFYSFPVFPCHVRKITLSGCGFYWDYMAHIGRLPNLEVLKLRCYAFCGTEWATVKGEFCKLKLLLLEDLDIERWEVGSDKHFPLLRHLIIRHCYKLKEIPRGIGRSKKLKMIELDDCSPSLVNSARQVYEDRHDWVNDYVPVQTRSSWNDR